MEILQIILNIIYIIVFILLLCNCIGYDKYSQNINIIHNRSELDQFYKYSQQQFYQKFKYGKIIECSGKYYCEFWCNPLKKHGNYILDSSKMRSYEGKSLQYGKDIHEYDFPIIIPNGYIEKTHIYFDIDNVKFLFSNLIKK